MLTVGSDYGRNERGLSTLRVAASSTGCCWWLERLAGQTFSRCCHVSWVFAREHTWVLDSGVSAHQGRGADSHVRDVKSDQLTAV